MKPSDLNENERKVLLNLSGAKSGKSWRSATTGTKMTESGSRQLLDRLRDRWELVSGGPGRYYITASGETLARKIREAKTDKEKQKPLELFT